MEGGVWVREGGVMFSSCEKIDQAVIAAVAVVSSLFVERDTGGVDNQIVIAHARHELTIDHTVSLELHFMNCGSFSK